MKIKELEKMESIVKKNRSLMWDGWTVLNIVKSESARTSKFGKCINGNWYISKRFEPSKDGWDIPDKFVD
jgi:hypothetical protein